MGNVLEKQIMQCLLQIYEEAQRTKKFDICQNIKRGALRWLSNLPDESYRPAPLLVMNEAIMDTQYVKRQYSSLTFLSMIAQQLTDSPPVVFDMLIPPLLALASLPDIGKFRSAPNLIQSPDLNVADLALTALSFMGSPGPAGQMLQFARQHFKEHPAQLRLLARNSLASRTLITPTVVPLIQENYEKYAAAIGQWIDLRNCYQINRITERDIDACLAIHQTLLACAEESSYPTAMHIVTMLQVQAEHPDLLWQEIWQRYLLAQLSSGRYIHYQEVALLWAMLFPAKQDLGILTGYIWQHYNGNTIALQRNAQRFIASLSSDLRNLRNLRNLRYPLLISEVMEQAIREVPAGDPIQYRDLLTIIMGCLLQIQETGAISPSVEREVQQAVYAAISAITSKDVYEEVIEAALDILRYLPARSADEVTIIRSAAESTRDSRIYAASALALQYSRPQTPDAWTAVESCKQSYVQAIREAAQEALKRKR